jgi:hypothetical protein
MIIISYEIELYNLIFKKGRKNAKNRQKDMDCGRRLAENFFLKVISIM